MHPLIETLQRTPIRPDEKTVRSVLASVFNVDLLGTDEITAQQAVVILAYKLLLDTGHDPDHLIHILRFFRKGIEGWHPHERAILNLSDNRYAMLFRFTEEFKVLDYRKCEVIATAPEPVFQASVNLRALAALLASAMESSGHSPTGVAAIEAAPS
jgi:hypothetical protein